MGKNKKRRRHEQQQVASTADEHTDGFDVAVKRAHLSESHHSATTASNAIPPFLVLVFAPGAGGTTAKTMRTLQNDYLAASGLVVVRCDDHCISEGEACWVTSSPGCAKNIALVLRVANEAAASHPDLPLLLCGASFGNRVLCEVFCCQLLECELQ